MPRASLCLLAGMLLPQLSSFLLLADRFRSALAFADWPLLPAAALVLAGGCRLLPPGFRRDLIWFLLGFASFALQALFVHQARLPEAYAGDSLVIELAITDFPRVTEAGTTFGARRLDAARVPARLRLTWYEAPVSLRPGDHWRMELRLKPPHAGYNPGATDQEQWLFRERIGAVGYVVDGPRTRLLDSGTSGGLAALREHVVARVQRVVAEPEAAAVLAALIVGARHLISDQQWDRYAATGISHLMAISGLHVGLVAAGAYALLALLLGCSGAAWNRRLPALAAALGCAAGYAVLSGFAVPARRASLMLACVAACALSRREAAMARVLAAAAVGVMLADPLAVLAPGFLLSFAAVALLLWLARRRPAQRGAGWARAIHHMALLAGLQCALLLGLAPLTASLFDRVSLAAPAVNLVAVPLFSFATVPLALLGLLLDGPFRPAGDALLGMSAATLVPLERLLAMTAGTGLASRAVAGLPGIAGLSLGLPVLWVLLPPRWPGRCVAWLGLLGLLAMRPAPPPSGCVRLAMLDVGQGLAIVGQTRAHAFLYDTGPAYRSGGTAAERVVLPYLAHAGIGRLDRVIVSHADLDHAGGLDRLVDSVPVRHVAAGERLWLPGRSVGRCVAGERWNWDGVSFTFLHPSADTALEGNAASCVLLIEAGARRALLAGDIEREVETELVQARVLPGVDVATVPHHGSRTSSIVPYVRAVAARYALVSAARHNQWELPKADIVERWRNAGAQVLNTADSGAIFVRLCTSEPTAAVTAWRDLAPRPWHAAREN